MRIHFTIIALFFSTALLAQIGKVGINTTTPAAMLHVKDSSVLFTGSSSGTVSGIAAPVNGAGVRMMWLPDRAAFRSGFVNGTQWNTDSIGTYSLACGLNNKARGTGSVSIGQGNSASSIGSIAMGNNNQATDVAAVAIGSGNIASGFEAVAIGSSNDATGDHSTAMGLSTNARGFNSFSLGFATEADGDYTIASGSQTDAIGINAASFGDHTKAVGDNSIASGIDGRSTGANSVTMGVGTRSRAFASLTIGQYNDSIAISSANTWISTDPVFIIGNGLTDNSRSNALTVLKNARTGINIETPVAGLHIKAIDNTFDQHIRLESTLGPASYANIVYDGSLKCRVFDAGATFQWRDNSSNTRMQLTSGGNLSIDGTLSQGSDVRLKRDIIPLQQSLQKILSLSGYQYYWIDTAKDKNIQTGVLAQEVEKQMPELVTVDADGMKAVNYSGMIPYLIEAIKELKSENEILKKELNLLKNR